MDNPPTMEPKVYADLPGKPYLNEFWSKDWRNIEKELVGIHFPHLSEIALNSIDPKWMKH